MIDSLIFNIHWGFSRVFLFREEGVGGSNPLTPTNSEAPPYIGSGLFCIRPKITEWP